MYWNIFLPVFVIILRNIFPISLLLAIIFACFQRIEHSGYFRQIYLGISGGIVASILVGSVISQGINNIDSTSNNAWIFTPLILNIFVFIAISLLIWFILWFSQQANFWQNLGSTNELLMGKNLRLTIFSLALFLVLIKGINIFLLLNVMPENNSTYVNLAVIASLLLTVLMTLAFVYLQTRLTNHVFFRIAGIFLILVTGGLIIDSLYNLDESLLFINELDTTANWCLFEQNSCLLGSILWSSHEILPEDKFPFILMKIVFGYHDIVYIIPLAIYLLFVFIVGKFYFQNLKNLS
ncbi:FTR1 family iron permease [Cyanobacterium aponinum]|uniref:Iron permease FTR1 n=1 Tax=Cyanobacterium aponinum (strain PCC 10605) TaxID=755178 RepID=K9Z2A8_CYAAP|nr:FTR1 family protein [Cyanobacterium aponinum]AFZ53279.1 iron permease FTR1 [Cyanobacterium aponinum PCC 10605]